MKTVGSINVDNSTERDRAEEALKAASEKLALHIANSPLAVIEWDKDFRVTRWSPEAERMFGWTGQETLGRDFRELGLVYDEDVAGVEQLVAGMVAGCDTRNVYRNRNRRKDGSVVWCDWYNSALLDSSGRMTSVFSQVMDTTERKQAEEALCESEKRFRQLAENVREVFWIGSPDWKEMYYISPGYEEVWGRSCESLYQRPLSWFDAVDEEFRQPILDGMRRRIAGEGSPVAFPEYRITRPDGSKRWILAKAFAVRDDEGRVYRIAGIAEDITELKQVEHALRESEEHFRLLVEQAGDALFLHAGGKFLLVNEQACRSLGYSREELLNLAVPDVEAVMSPEQMARQREQAVLGQPVTAYGMHRRKDGTVFPVEVRISLFRAESDGSNVILALARDITQRVQAEEALRKARDELEVRVRERTADLQRTVEQLRDEIIARQQADEQRRRLEAEVLRISEEERQKIGQDLHDSLGQNLTGLAFLGSVLAKELQAQSLPQAKQAEEMVRLLNQSTRLSRSLARGLSPLAVSPEGFASSLRELAADVEMMFCVSCVVNCDETVPALEAQIAMHLYRIVQEAISNALRHGKAQHIQVSFQRDGANMRLSVTDDGVGIPDDAASARGMGLRIMTYRANSIGATLTISRRAEGGTAVVCVLPMAEQAGTPTG